VRGVGNELALLLEGSLQPQQEVVQRHDEGHDLGRHVPLGQRIERDRGARAHRPRDVHQRPQTAANDQPEQHPEHRQQEQERRDDAQRGGERQPVAQMHRLRHLDHLSCLLQSEDPPLAAAAVDRRVAQRQAMRQLRPRLRQVDAGAVGGPDLDRELLRLVFVAGLAPQGAVPRLIAKRQCQLPQLVIEQRAGFVACRAIGRQRPHQGGEGDDRQQRQQQLAADRPHAAAGTR